MELTARALARRLAAAMMLVAVLALGLHEAANPQTAVSAGGAPPPALAVLQLAATLDHDEADRGPTKHSVAAQDAIRVCVVATPLPWVVAVVSPAASILGIPTSAAVLPGLHPGGPQRPPRSTATA
ncbi:hypothetical protein E2C06_25840 [Dankookia rubra]|uniref:DUF2946 domain-containing protein n=1 Tax=Dankookia rubra TaxID=1442381 RepID=A0A4R5QAA7_9PROT|nr:hypothetical protein [Dankookia rubra]TDH59706.1 hypothetical protein E2C06_25840 [Dankookia rubra]